MPSEQSLAKLFSQYFMADKINFQLQKMQHLMNFNEFLTGCILGMFRENTTQTCKACEIGKHKNTTGDHACTTCPPKSTTFKTGEVNCGKNVYKNQASHYILWRARLTLPE